MVNRTLILDRLDLLKEYLTELKKIRDLPKQQVINDSLYLAAVESYLRRSLEVIFDLGRHILAKTGKSELALEYKSIANGLMEAGIVNNNLGEKLVLMAGYRNRLVHLYNLVSKEELMEIIEHDLGDLEEFLQQIYQYIGG